MRPLDAQTPEPAPQQPAADPHPSETALAELVARAQRGDEAAFGKLVETLQPRMALRIRHRLGAKMRCWIDADDILQDTFLEAFRLLPLFSWTRNGCVLRWLEVIAEHQIQHAIRKQRHREREVSLITSSSHGTCCPKPVGANPAADSATGSQVAVRNETCDRVTDALDRLSPERREVVLLVHVCGMKAKEAAKRLGRSPQAVGVLLFRALRQLRSLLKSAGFEPPRPAE